MCSRWEHRIRTCSPSKRYIKHELFSKWLFTATRGKRQAWSREDLVGNPGFRQAAYRV